MNRAAHTARAGRALQKLAEVDPAFAVLGLWCRHADSDANRGPAWSDATTIYYGPDFETLPPHEQIGLAAHHILHIAFRHAARSRRMHLRFGAGFDADVYNIAADALINETLELAGYALPRPTVRASDLMADLGEDMRGELAPGKLAPGKLAPGKLAPGEIVSSLDADALYVRMMAGRTGQDRAGRELTGQIREAGTGDGEGRGQQILEAAEAHGYVRDLEQTEGDAGSDDEGQVDFDWRQRLARALDAGREAGRGLGALGFRLADIPAVGTPWDVVLRGLLTKAVMHDPRLSWRRPTGRWLAMESEARRIGAPVPVFEPSTARQREIPRIVVGVDSSGSIDTHRLGLFAAQVAGIGRRTGAEVHVLVFDEEVRAHHRMQGGRWAQQITEIAFSRDGGTNFADVIARAAALDPSAIVILTDLDGPHGELTPRVPVIWAVPHDPRRAPPFGRVLSLAR